MIEALKFYASGSHLGCIQVRSIDGVLYRDEEGDVARNILDFLGVSYDTETNSQY